MVTFLLETLGMSSTMASHRTHPLETNAGGARRHASSFHELPEIPQRQRSLAAGRRALAGV